MTQSHEYKGLLMLNQKKEEKMDDMTPENAQQVVMTAVGDLADSLRKESGYTGWFLFFPVLNNDSELTSIFLGVDSQSEFEDTKGRFQEAYDQAFGQGNVDKEEDFNRCLISLLNKDFHEALSAKDITSIAWGMYTHMVNDPRFVDILTVSDDGKYVFANFQPVIAE